jgi:hypothetical protein
MDGSRWTACRQQLEAALRAMPGHVEFVVVLFSSRLTEPPGQTGWMRAESGAVERVLGWRSHIHPSGGMDPGPAFDRVFSESNAPDVIYFLTDGDIGDFSPERCAHLRGGASTIVNTIALESEPEIKTPGRAGAQNIAIEMFRVEVDGHLPAGFHREDASRPGARSHDRAALVSKDLRRCRQHHDRFDADRHDRHDRAPDSRLCRNGRSHREALDVALARRGPGYGAYRVALGYAQGPGRQAEEQTHADHREPPSRSTLERLAKGIGTAVTRAAAPD